MTSWTITEFTSWGHASREGGKAQELRDLIAQLYYVDLVMIMAYRERTGSRLTKRNPREIIPAL